MVGAFALSVADAVHTAVSDRGHSGAAPAALTTLLAYPGSSIDRLRRALALTHSGGVRLVDRLEAGGLVRRTAARDGRVAALELTVRGKRVACDILERRRRAVADLLAPLSAAERRTLGALLERMLEPIPDDRRDLERICRLCDYWVCDGSTQACPVGRGARAKRDAAPR